MSTPTGTQSMVGAASSAPQTDGSFGVPLTYKNPVRVAMAIASSFISLVFGTSSAPTGSSKLVVLKAPTQVGMPIALSAQVSIRSNAYFAETVVFVFFFLSFVVSASNRGRPCTMLRGCLREFL